MSLPDTTARQVDLAEFFEAQATETEPAEKDERPPLRFASDETTYRSCRNCGGHVTLQFARVFGDNQDEVHGCFSCYSQSAIKRGAAREDFEGGIGDV